MASHTQSLSLNKNELVDIVIDSVSEYQGIISNQISVENVTITKKQRF